ncbi:cache domain-containing sensor histidine kinase [Cohnella thailandensis]|uniref:Sensor histidine kinase n=1 Tax=Cohnella thailandensis TaxID=557557 RepID=A0A841T6K0_9BACL|nr:sensor histidine kinase [Cohnella thailandensis]MBB6637690.1 sensor histidine kinase [Cohnella thailandensis]MBP1974133.1 two-component system sensor histidine kinase YesM [Cohnella thailandensis]
MLPSRLFPTFVSLRTKMLVLFCLMVTVPFLLSGAITYSKYSARAAKDAQAYSDQLAEQVAINLERYIQELERITLSLYYDDNALDILTRHDGGFRTGNYLASDESFKMNQLISSAIYERTEVAGVFIFALDGSLFSNLQETSKSSWLPQENEWMREAEADDGGLTVLPPASSPNYLTNVPEVASIARLIKNPYTNAKLGFVKVDLTSSGFEKILSSVRITENSKLYIFNRNGEMIYPFDSNQEGLAAGNPEEEALNDRLRQDGRTLVSERETGYGGLRIMGIIPRSDLQKDARELISFILWISLASLLAAYLISVLASNQLVKPIRSLYMKMKRVQNGELGERAPIMTNDEIGLLTAGFNGMVAQLDKNIKEIYELGIREKQAELSALQSQINPHFLYNTLESISMAAGRDRQDELSRVISSLGKLLRYTVNRQESKVTLREELDFVENYLSIQSFRLEDRLRADIRVDFSHESVLVPKLLLQPLVENAIEHGMGSKPLTLTLTTKADEQDLLIRIEDDGRGIGPERLNQIERILAEVEPIRAESVSGTGNREKGFALRNIHRRLRILYGESYGLSLDKSRTQGAAVHVRIPFQWGES